jgi:hypothetical protein
MIILPAPVTIIRWVGSVIGRTLGSAYEGRLVVVLVKTTFGKVVILVVRVGCVRTVFD